MKRMLIGLVIILAASQLTSCARYKLSGGKRKSSNQTTQEPQNFNGNGGLVINANPNQVGPNTPVNFTAQCFDNQNVTVRWNFSDGQSATGLNLSHPFAQAGSYPVTAVCTHANGQSLTKQVTVQILNINPLPNPGNDPAQNCGCCPC